MAEKYARAAELLRRLASPPNCLPCDARDAADLKDALMVAAQACEQVDQAVQECGFAEQEREEAMLQAAHLWSLLDRAAEVVDARIACDDGGTWETLTLAFELRQAVESEPDALGERLLAELQAARVALRAADVLAAAVRRGDGETARQCMAAFQQASCAYQVAASTRQATGEIGVVAAGARR